MLGFTKKESLETPEFQAQPLVILHLSDIHFRDPKYEVSRSKASARFLKALKKHLESWRERFPEYHDLATLFITGDITYQCKPDDFAWAKGLIEEVLKETGIPGNRLYIVPGEHDVYLRFVKNTDDGLQLATAKEWNRLLQDERKGKSQRIAGRFDAYLDFLRTLGVELGSRMPCAQTDFFYADVFDHGASKIAILGLNSAWASRCRLEADRGMLCLGAYQVKDAYSRSQKINKNKDPDIVLSLLHHPPEWMKPEDQEALDNLAQFSHAIFQGHGHKGRDSIMVKEKKVPVISVSSLLGMEEPIPGFSITAIDQTTRKAYVWPYLWNRDDSAFLSVADHEPPLQGSRLYAFDLSK